MQIKLKVAQETHRKKVDELQKTSQANLQKAQTLEAVSFHHADCMFDVALINMTIMP